MNIGELLEATPVLPVVTLEDEDHALPLAEALLAGGIGVVEITLRTPAGLAGIRRIRDGLPEIVVGAGTVLSSDDLERTVDAGARFAVSPGSTPALLEAARESGLPFLPGIQTASDILSCLAHDFRILKFFPAESSGGAPALRALASVFGELRFCPTGGITESLADAYRAIPGVVTVGGSWLTPAKLLQEGNWPAIKELARRAAEHPASVG